MRNNATHYCLLRKLVKIIILLRKRSNAIGGVRSYHTQSSQLTKKVKRYNCFPKGRKCTMKFSTKWYVSKFNFLKTIFNTSEAILNVLKRLGRFYAKLQNLGSISTLKILWLILYQIFFMVLPNICLIYCWIIFRSNKNKFVW